MLAAKFITTDDELMQVAQLSSDNLGSNLSDAIKASEGFVTWEYSIDTLRTINHITPSVIVKDGNKVAGYALVLTREMAPYYEPLHGILNPLKDVIYQGVPLLDYRVYFMGQICIHTNYRGQGLVDLLYKFHRMHFSSIYNLSLTAIFIHNLRSKRAHEKVGFKHLVTIQDETEDWDIVVWDWRS